MHLMGYDVNLIWSVLVFFTFMVTVGGSLAMTFLERFMPKWFAECYKYGKSSGPVESGNAWVKMVQVPKSYFAHFYIYAAALHSALLFVVLNVYMYGVELPDWMFHAFDFLATKGRARSGVTPESVLMALALMTVQVWFRMHECLHVNAPSKAKINVLHYLTGFFHYTCVGCGIVSHAPGLLRPHSLHVQGEEHTLKWIHIQLKLTNVTLMQVLAAGLFIWAMKHQRIAHKILARTKRQAQQSGGYGLPSGDWFELVSCPHYTAECLLYISLLTILGPDHTTAILLLVWVLANQIMVALMSHQWYKDNFPNYSKKAIIPYVL